MIGIDDAPPQTLNPDHILQIGIGIWASKTLLSAVELELFTRLGKEALTVDDIAAALDLHPRSRYDFSDALVALGLLGRDGDGPDAVYRNTPATALFLGKSSPAYVGGILEMANARLYVFWGSLTEALHTGQPQNEIKTGAPGLYADPERLQVFLDGMRSQQLGAFSALCNRLSTTPGATGVEWSSVDLAAFGRPARLVWHERRWSCPVPGCATVSFSETAPRIAAALGRGEPRRGRPRSWGHEQPTEPCAATRVATATPGQTSTRDRHAGRAQLPRRPARGRRRAGWSVPPPRSALVVLRLCPG